MAKAKIKTDLVELARAFLSSDGFNPEVIKMMPAEVVYSFESAMETVLVSTEGFQTFKNQWIACYHKHAKAWAKNELSRAWALALESATRFVERENEAGNDGQDLFDQRYRSEFATHAEEINKIRRTGSVFETIAPKEASELMKLCAKLDAVIPVKKTMRHKKPGSCAERGKGGNKLVKSGGAKKRGVKCRKNNKSK